jgi:UDP-N-acetylglucosamine acyltransferase
MSVSSPRNPSLTAADAPEDKFIHPSAVVSPHARLGHGCYIGPYSIVGPEVVVGDETHVFPFVSIGLASQDLKYKGEEAETHIGRRNRIREFVTIHRGTEGGGRVTRTGDDCLIMAQAHIAHDCILGKSVIMANGATLAGHVTVEDGANIGAYSGVHQFCRVGREAYVGGYSVVVKDALPFALSVGNHAKCYGLNITGMKRRGYAEEVIKNLHHAFHLLLSSKLNTSQAVARIRAELKESKEVDELVLFIEKSERGVIK